MIPVEPARHRFRWGSGFGWGLVAGLAVAGVPFLTVLEVAAVAVMVWWANLIINGRLLRRSRGRW